MSKKTHQVFTKKKQYHRVQTCTPAPECNPEGKIITNFNTNSYCTTLTKLNQIFLTNYGKSKFIICLNVSTPSALTLKDHQVH